MSLPPPKDNYAGEPEYPAPWTTGRPKEGLRDIGEARIICLAPDVCLTPVGNSVVPIPYQIVDYCGDDQGYTPSVRFTGKKAMVLRSSTTCVHGDAPGTRKGVKSGTVEDICEPIGHAPEVRAEGSNVIRHLDRFHMNCKNTVGEAIFVRDTATYQAPEDDDPVPGSLVLADSSGEGVVMSDASPDPLIMGAQYAQALPAQPLPGAAPGTQPPRPGVGGPNNVIQGPWQSRPMPTPPSTENMSPLVRYGRWGLIPLILMLGGDTPLIPHLGPDADEIEGDLNRRAREALDPIDHSYNERVRDWYFEELQAYREQRSQQEQQAEENDKPQSLPQSETVRVTEREEYRKKCQVDRYAKMKNICGQYGMQAHHIVPDWTLRYGARNESDKRIPNMPSLNDGQAICVMGHATSVGSEHDEAHFADGAIEALGATSNPPYTAPLSQVVRKSAAAMIEVRPDCAKQIMTAIGKQFVGLNPNQLLRAKRLPPLPVETIRALKSAAIRSIP